MMSLAPLAFAQSDTNSITVSVSRSATVQPDQVVFGVTVQSGLNTVLDDVLAAVQPAGITASNFIGVSSNNFVTVPPTPALTWTFSLTAPFSKQKDTVTSLTGLQQMIAQGKAGLTLSFGVAGTQVSAQALQSQVCSLADLVSDAKAQAQKIADAAGVTVGSILALSSGTAINTGSYAPASVAIVGAYVSYSSFLSSPTSAPPCALTMKFSLLRFQ